MERRNFLKLLVALPVAASINKAIGLPEPTEKDVVAHDMGTTDPKLQPQVEVEFWLEVETEVIDVTALGDIARQYALGESFYYVNGVRVSQSEYTVHLSRAQARWR